MGLSWVADTGAFLWASWGALGLLIGIPIILVLIKMVFDSINSTKRFEALFNQYNEKFKRQDDEISRINKSLHESEKARLEINKSNTKYHHLIASYSSIISSMVSALRMMQRVRELENSDYLEKQIDVLMLNIESDLKSNDLMHDSDSLINKKEG